MKNKLVKYFLSVIILVSAVAVSGADDCFPKAKNRYVNDYTGTLSPEELSQLENTLGQFDQSTSTQIAIVIVDDLCGYDKAQYSTELAHKWGVGQKDKDNGIVILVKPTGGSGQRQTHIAVGYGLEGVIPDAIAKRIVENEMIPQFKTGNIAGGLSAAVTVIMQLSEGEYSADQYQKRTSGGAASPIIFIIIIAIFIFISRFGSTRNYARRNNLGFWAALMLMSSTGRSHGGGFGGFSSGGGSFGGFGGGGFGGGGAGGSW